MVWFLVADLVWDAYLGEVTDNEKVKEPPQYVPAPHIPVLLRYSLLKNRFKPFLLSHFEEHIKSCAVAPVACLSLQIPKSGDEE